MLRTRNQMIVRSSEPRTEVTEWRIEEFTVTLEEAKMGAARAVFSSSSRGRYVPAGTYRRLTRNGLVIMSDTPDELSDLAEFRLRATGKVLINGLGLGCAAKMALDNPAVSHVTVVEIDQAVIELVAPTLGSDRIKLILGDALNWHPPCGERWNIVWHDIWDYICADNLVEMRSLHRRYGSRCDWQGSWCRRECERARRRSLTTD